MDTKYVDFSFKLTTYMKNDEEKKKFSLPEQWQLLTENLINPSHNGRGRITGKINNLTVFDFDNEATYEKFMNDHPNININDLKRTKSGRGWHIHFLHDETLKNTSDVFKDYEGVDIRNDGGFITIAPTTYKKLDGTIIEYKQYDGDLIHVPFEFRHCLKSSVIKKPTKKIVKEVKEEDNQKLISQILPIIKDMANDYTNWIKVGMALKHSSEDNLNLFHDFSKFCIEKYIEDDVNTAWDRITDGPLNLGSLIYWAKEIDYETTMDIISKYKTDEYLLLKHEWEGVKRLAFIHSISQYCYEVNGSLLFKRKEDMKNSLANIQFIKNEKETSFFETWNKDKTRKEYMDIGMISPDMKQDNTILNLWTPFYCQTLNFDTVIDIQPILDFIKVIAGNDDDAYTYILKYIKNMIMFPSKPQQMICLASIEEGTGKSTFINLLIKLIGLDKCFTTKNISKDVCDKFNGHLEYKVLTHLEDIEPDDYRKHETEIRSIINKEYMPIHHKGQKMKQLKHFNHFIMTTNYLHTIKYTDIQRRIMGVEVSNDYLGKTEIFEKLRNLLDNDHVIYSFYKYLIDKVECPAILTKNDIPMTKLMKEGCEMNVDNIVSFVKNLENKEYQTLQLYDMFKGFTSERGYNDKRTYNTFAKDLKREIEKQECGIYKEKVKNLDDGSRSCGYVIHHKIEEILE